MPQTVRFQEGWRIGLDLIDRTRADLPFGWVAGDDEFGRPSAFRAELRKRRLRYVLDVPCNTLVRDIDEEPPAGKRCPPWRRVDDWARTLPASLWRRVELGAGSKGPRVVRVAQAWVQARDDKGRVGPLERLVVPRAIDGEPRTWYTLSNASKRVGMEEVARAQGRRHGVEELLEAGKGEVGLGHYEVRGWVGWHHHVTLSLLALWFLQLEKRQLGGENPGIDGAAAARGVHAAAVASATQCAADSLGGKPGATPQRGGSHLPLVRTHQEVPTSPRATRRVERLQ